MGCSQSASKPVPRPDNEQQSTGTNESNTHNSNGQNGTHIPQALGNSTISPPPHTAAASSNGVHPGDVHLTMTSPNGTTVPAALATDSSSTSQPPQEVAAQAASVANTIASGASPANVVTRPAITQSLTVNPEAKAVVHVSKQRPLVVCGPSGVGKGTLLSRLLKEYPHVFAKSVSHTTRGPRAGEINGQHYHFTHVDELLQAVKDKHFIEHANVHGNYYGTSISSVATVMDSGKICLLEIDIQGVISVKAVKSLNPLSIFIRAPTFQDLVDRLTGRGSESEHTMQKRLDTARSEMDFFYTNRHMFEADIINSEFEESYHRMIQVIQRLYPEVDLSKPVKPSAL